MCTPSRAPAKRRGGQAASRRRCAAAVEAAAARVRAGDWAGAGPEELVALYAWMHREVYGVCALAELRPQWHAAVASAAGLLRQEFDGDAAEAVEYLRWVCAREVEREQWRREKGRGGGRLSWRAVLARREVLTEWRIDLRRRSK